MSAFSSQGMVEIFEQSVYNEIPWCVAETNLDFDNSTKKLT